jgi:hypothetical protein
MPYSCRHKFGSQKSKTAADKDWKDAAYHHDITNYFKSTEESSKTYINTLTASANIAEHKHYDPPLLNCNVSRTEIPVPKMKHMKRSASYAAKNIQIYHK